MLKRNLFSLLTVLSLLTGGFFMPTSPARADVAANDATLASLRVFTGQWRVDAGLSPWFTSDQTWYSYASTKQENNIQAAATNPDAKVQVKWLGNTEDITSSETKTLQLPIAVTPITITVTAADGTTKKDYLVNAQIGVMMQPQLLSMSQTSGGTLGGEHVTMKVKNVQKTMWWQNGVDCYSEVRTILPNGTEYYASADVQSVDNNGVATLYSNIYNPGSTWYLGKASIKITNICGGTWDSGLNRWMNMSASNIFKDAWEFKELKLDTPVLSDASMTPYGRFTLSGLGINTSADVWGFMQDPAYPDEYLYFWSWGWISNTKGSYYFESVPYDKDWNYTFDHWNKPGKKMLYVLKCGSSWGTPQYCWQGNNGNTPGSIQSLKDNGNLLYSTEVNYRPDYPSLISLSPAKGSVNGGNKIRVKGHVLRDYKTGTPVIKIGGQPMTDLRIIEWGDTSKPDSLDIWEGTVPASTTQGPATVTVTNHWGDTTAAVKYIYSDKPQITSITPSTVANSGGSLITINGKNFGTSGTPSVTIDGQKSQCVTRVSDTKVIAMVPATTSVGSVDVNLISGAGGGSPDLPSSLTVAAPSTLPTVSKVTPSSVAIGGGDEVTLTGTNFGAAGTVGVMVGGNCAKVTASTATSITIEVPSGDAAGATDITVGTTTGAVVKVGGITYNATPGVTSVAPSAITSSATGDAAKIVITGNGFGSSGKIKVGSAAEVSYTATDGGTKISGVVVPTSVIGTLSISITPTGAKEPFISSVKVNGPTLTYFGANPHNGYYEWATGWESSPWSAAPFGKASGGDVWLLEGKDLGTGGTVKLGTASATIVSWTDTAVVFKTPALAVGTYDLTLKPTSGGGSAVLAKSYQVIADAAEGPTITQIAAVEDNGRVNAEHTFDGEADQSDVFEITGRNLAGNNQGATTKVILNDGEKDYSVTPISVSATSIKFHAPRGIYPVRWVSLKVITSTGEYYQDHGILYVGNAPAPVVFSPGSGLCAKDAIGTYNPTSLGLTGPDGFGTSGSVTIGGVEIPDEAVSWSKGSISVNFDSITSNFTTLWGYQTVVFTPDDSSLVARTYGFNCGVDTNVKTRLNGKDDSLTIAAGTSYTATATMNNPLPGTAYNGAADGYVYVSASDYNQFGWTRNVQTGLPIAAGDYYVRVGISSSAYDTNKYYRMTAENDVHLVINGTAVTFTPKLTSGAGTEITYNGPLGDGTGGSTNDISYTKTATNDSVTKIYYEYRNHQCDGNANVGWTPGLPSGVAISPTGTCGGDGSSVTSWDIRVRGFDMIVNGVNRNIYYLPTYNTFNLTIKKKGLTLTKVTAEKVYDGKTEITLGEINVTGAVNNETPTLDSQISKGNFADAKVGNGKAITLGGAITLSSEYRGNYEILNPNLVFTGSIKKSDAQLRLTSAVPSVIMTNPQPFEVTATTKDVYTGQAPVADANVSPVVITSGSTGVCTVSGTTVTPVKAGDCIINATQAASLNYNASKSYNDDSSTVESITIKIFAAPKAVQIVADDITVARGESISPSSQAIGLVDGDGLNDVKYDIYSGTTLLTEMPSTPGTYKIVPKDAQLQAADMAAYQPTFKYVAGKLIITQVPPTVTKFSATHGPEAGGENIIITGTNLGDVTSIVWAGVTIRKPAFVVNGDGTEITLKVPAGKGQAEVVLKAGAAEVPGSYLYDPPPPVTAPLELSLKLNLEIGTKLSGQKVTIKGGGLKPGSDYILELHSTTVVIYQGIADSNGNFLQILTLPGKACVPAGTHSFKLTGIKPDGSATSDEAFFEIGDNCIVGNGKAEKTVVNDKVSWTLSGFLFKYNDAALTKDAEKSLTELLKLIKGAKTVTISGYTETDTKSEAVKKANLKLAKNRCTSVKNWLVSKKLKANYKLIGKGGVEPVSLTDQSKNRRVVIVATF